MGKRKLIKIITVQGVLSKKEILGPEFKGNKPGINGIRTRKAIATNQILFYGVSVCYSFEMKKKSPHIRKEKSLPFSVAFWHSFFSDAPVSSSHPCSPVLHGIPVSIHQGKKTWAH